MFLPTAKPNTFSRTKGAQALAKDIGEHAQDPSGAAANQPSLKALQAPSLAADPLGAKEICKVSLLLTVS